MLRRYVDPTVLASEPRAVEREAAVLRAVGRLAPRVPELIASDARATSCPVPTLLMTRVAGRLGVDAADTFLRSWQRHSGATEYDPSWDLRDAVDALPDLRDTTAALDRLDQLLARSAALV